MTVESLTPAAGPLRGDVSVPGSKSISNRALICAALANGESRVSGVAGGDDTARMIDGLRVLGAALDVSGDEERSITVRVRSAVAYAATAPVQIDAGLAGTTSRFLTAVAALRTGTTTVTGAPGLVRRPMSELHRLLRDLGASVQSERDGYLPVTLQAGDHAKHMRHITARGDVSSQFISGVMMIAPLLGGVQIRIDGPVVSREYLEMTARVMQAFGGVVEVSPSLISVAAGEYSGISFEVDSDWSSASYPFAAAAIVGGSVTVPGLQSESMQPEAQFVDVLARMGCVVRHDRNGVTVSRDPDRDLIGIEVDMSSMSDLVPTVAALAACANGMTRISGVGFIRAKESDRLGDLATELRKCGAQVEVEPDGLAITPAPLRAAVIDPHDDHRLAMSLALLGLRQSGISVSNAEVVSKSWPNYWSAMRLGLR